LISAPTVVVSAIHRKFIDGIHGSHTRNPILGNRFNTIAQDGLGVWKNPQRRSTPARSQPLPSSSTQARVWIQTMASWRRILRLRQLTRSGTIHLEARRKDSNRSQIPSRHQIAGFPFARDLPTR
jgi:hypothetical protein